MRARSIFLLCAMCLCGSSEYWNLGFGILEYWNFKTKQMRNTNDRKFIFSTVILLLLSLDVMTQTTYFRVIGGIPHLPVLSSTSKVSSPASGMVIYSTGDACPMVYTGSAWADLCTNSSFTANSGYFRVVKGIPVFPVKSSASGSPVVGNVYLSSAASGVLQLYNGSSWVNIDNMGGFSSENSGSNMNTYLKIPVLSSYPSSVSAGAFFIRRQYNTLYCYTGSTWKAVTCTLYAPDGTEAVDLTLSNGQTWMDRNLGATRAATSSTDYEAYGSLYQWCRAADGHQLITWTGTSDGTPVNGYTTTRATSSTNVGHSLFIRVTSSANSWYSSNFSNGNLWWNGSVVGANNPCPKYYHVPTYTECLALKTAEDNDVINRYDLNLTGGPTRSYNSTGELNNNYAGYNWTSSIYSGSTSEAWVLTWTMNYMYYSLNHRPHACGCIVRCIRDQ